MKSNILFYILVIGILCVCLSAASILLGYEIAALRCIDAVRDMRGELLAGIYPISINYTQLLQSLNISNMTIYDYTAPECTKCTNVVTIW